ncbi:CgeB family protein [Paenibacillus humicola]|uniref:CgeB family protein n=1 Tax=Paenibacillus humicola TaxID=3110540 RepID=UPI00237AF1FC|nr:glycosyltransferase [Paenibacillus humicola]
MKILFLNSAPIVKLGMGRGFVRLGHEVEFIHPGEQEPDVMLAKIDAFKPDLLFTDGGVGRVEAITGIIDRTGIPHIYWGIEDPVARNMSLAYGRKSVLTLTTFTEWIDELYRPNGIRAISVPFACNPGFHRRGVYRPELARELAFVGNNYEVHPNRLAGNRLLFEPLIGRGADIAFYGGAHWVSGKFAFRIPQDMYKGYMAYEHWPDLCASVPFILGVHSINGSKTMQSMRTFEVLGCAGFFFTQHTTAIEAMFENHTHLVWSRSPEETLELYDYYRSRPDAMERIRKQGQQFVYDHHTYDHRAAQILEALKPLL